MIGGQVIDMLADASFGVTDVKSELVSARRPASLFEFSCEAGPILGESFGEPKIAAA